MVLKCVVNLSPFLEYKDVRHQQTCNQLAKAGANKGRKQTGAETNEHMHTWTDASTRKQTTPNAAMG